MIGDLPDLRLETWFSRWEFAATTNSAVSDVQTPSVGERLALARRDVTDLADIGLAHASLEGWRLDRLRV